MSIIDRDPALELASRQHDAAVATHTGARTAYEAVQERIGGLDDDAAAEDVEALDTAAVRQEVRDVLVMLKSAQRGAKTKMDSAPPGINGGEISIFETSNLPGSSEADSSADRNLVFSTGRN